ncbi:MAG: hypothetical protein R3F35_14965 [Myxococcota bacterium]
MRRLMRRDALFRATVFVVAGVALLACRRLETPTPARIEVPVGAHRIELALPSGWRYVVRGDEQTFVRSRTRVRLWDLGPVTAESVVEDLEHARALYRKGRWETVRERLARVPMRRLLRSETRWESIEPDWRRIAWLRVDDGVVAEVRIGPGLDPRVEAAFDRVAEAAAAIPERDLEAITREAIARLAPESPTEVVALDPLTISGRPALRVTTRDRLSHALVRTHLCVSNQGRLFVLHTQVGDGPSQAHAFDALVAGLDLLP